MNQFVDALIAEEPNPQYKDKLMLFGQFVGSWEFTWEYLDEKGEKTKEKGEWIFSWVLNGNAVQDIFITPARQEKGRCSIPDREYGSTLRIYNPQKDAWDIFYGCHGEATLLEARQVDDKIELNWINRLPNKDMKWVFSEITEQSFHWQCLWSEDNGSTWGLGHEYFAKRKVLE